MTEADDWLDAVPQVGGGDSVNQRGNFWILGSHRLLCGDARSNADVSRLCSKPSGGTDQIAMIFTDPPYNVKIDGHVSGAGKINHREFAEASGEMIRVEFTVFLTETLGAAAARFKDGGIAYVCMDWRHIGELLAAGETVFTELKNLCVWNKTNGGMGTFYRSKHELVFVFKKGRAPHTNNFGLGEGGRYRTNVWDYAGISSLTATRAEEQVMHPTVKPVAMVADAMRDCSNRGDVILDTFVGSGSTMIAAEECGRKARLLELDPAYCDVTIQRWQKVTGKQAVLQSSDGKYGCGLEALDGAQRPSVRPADGIDNAHNMTLFEQGFEQTFDQVTQARSKETNAIEVSLASSAHKSTPTLQDDQPVAPIQNRRAS